MKNFKIVITATTQKELEITAKNLQEAFDMGFDIVSEGDVLTFDTDDIIALTGEVIENSKEENDCEFNCKNCVNRCDECGSCLLDDDDFTEEDGCFDCEFYCDECGACFSDNDDKDGYIDEELALRKQIFQDYLNRVFKETKKYAKELFCEE